GKLVQDTYIEKLVKCMDSVFLEKYGIHPNLVCDKQQFLRPSIITSTGFFKKPKAILEIDTTVSSVIDTQIIEIADPVESEKSKESDSINEAEVKPKSETEPLIDATRRAGQEHRLFRCTVCLALIMSPILPEWLRPGNNGIIYNIAKKKFGTLYDKCRYVFKDFNLSCYYESKKDILIMDGLGKQKCHICSSKRVRQVEMDDGVKYENGDITLARSPSNKVCVCGYKHFYGGKAYDNPPDMINVYMSWNGRNICEEVAWFQFESDTSLNSNVYQIAEILVQKFFPGEFATGTITQQVISQLLSASKCIMDRQGQPQCSSVSTSSAKDERQKVSMEECDVSSSVTAVIKLPDEEVVKSYADTTEICGDESSKTLVVEEEEGDKNMFTENMKDNVDSTNVITSSFFEEALRKAQHELQTQHQEYKNKKIKEYNARDQRFLDTCSNPDYAGRFKYGPTASAYRQIYEETQVAVASGHDEGSRQEEEEQPTTTVRVGPGYSVLAPRRVARVPSPRSSRGASNSASPSQIEDDGEHRDPFQRQGRGNLNSRARFRRRQ
ncbi:hypothetical protein L9F63_021742, partial [Diploptera punctata]